MDSEALFTTLAPPVFKGEGYRIWAARMEAYMEANDLRKAVEEDDEVPPLPENPTIVQMRNHKEKKTRKSKARATLFATVSSEIFVKIMTLKLACEFWNFLKKKYEGNERVKGMRTLNLIREFELQKMKDSETIKEYSNRLLNIANNVRLLGSAFPDSRLVQKILVTVLEWFETTISALENSKDLSQISLAELLNALQAQDQRRLVRSKGSVEGALPAKVQSNQGDQGKKKWNNKGNSGSHSPEIHRGAKHDFPPCRHYGKKGHPPFKCWRRPDQQGEECQQMGHHQKVCKNNTQQTNVAQVANQEDEEQLFVATCLATSCSSDKWLIDSGCTNHMTFDRDLFKELDTSVISKVQVGNGDYISVEMKCSSGTKLIKDVFFVPNISHSLFSVGQMLENGFKLHFESNYCQIKDEDGRNLFKVMMKGRSFILDLLDHEQKSYSATKISTKDSDISTMLLGAVGQPRLLVPVALVMIFNRWNGILVPEYGFMHLELIPMLVGFFTYKIATFVQAIEEGVSIIGNKTQA
ncbi:putative keratin, type I cytoskeletal 9-like [Capsicum annuum]|nr:putative keratin, type I cytoskeletal 9-like [Capsicum annuum]